MAKKPKTASPGPSNIGEGISPFDRTAKRPQLPKRKPKLKKAKTGHRGPRAYVPSDEDRAVATALAQVGFSREDLGRHFGVEVKTIDKHFQKELRVAKGTLLAHGYGAVAKALRTDDGRALSAGKFVLATKGKDYGWGGKAPPPLDEDAFAGADPSLLTPKQWAQFVELLAIMGVDISNPYGARPEPKLIGSNAPVP